MTATSSAVSFVQPQTLDNDKAMRLKRLMDDFKALDTHALLEKVIAEEFSGKIAVSSSLVQKQPFY